jgi:hypothetical protein
LVITETQGIWDWRAQLIKTYSLRRHRRPSIAPPRTDDRTRREPLGRLPAKKVRKSRALSLVLQDHVQQRAVNLETAAVIVDKAQPAKLIHEETDARARRANHLRERLLANLRDDRLGPPFLTEVRQQQQKARKSLLAGIEQLIHQVCFNPDCSRQEMRDENLGERRLVAQRADDARLLQPHDDAFRHRRHGRDAPWLPGQASLAAELVGSQDCDDRFFALVGNDGELGLALLDVEDGIGNVTLGEDDIIPAIFGYGSAVADLGEKDLGPNGARRLVAMARRPDLRQRTSSTKVPSKFRWRGGLIGRGRHRLYISHGNFSSRPVALTASKLAQRSRTRRGQRRLF